MAEEALVGIDLGTSGVKAAVVGAGGAVLAEAEESYPVAAPRPGWAETEPELWWRATASAVRAALAQARESAPIEVIGLGLDGQMHGLVLARGGGAPVRPALLWADQRAESVLPAWVALPGELRTRLANPLVPGMAGPMLAWLAEHESGTVGAARWALLPKDWLRLRLTGRAATEPSDASATLLWDIPADTWSAAAIAQSGFTERLLPPLRPSDAVAGTLTGEASADLGLPDGLPVAAGASDTAAALLASALRPGEVQVTVGSGAQITTLTDDPAPVSGIHVYRTAESAGWYRMAAVANAGLALNWVRSLLRASWAEVYASCVAGEPGAGGVTFVPHLARERAVEGQPTGRLSGLRLGTDRTAVLRAAVEGVAFSLRRAASLLPGGTGASMRLAGGGGRDPGVRRLLADVLGVELRPFGQRSASVLGAVLLAARAVGVPDPSVPLAGEPPVSPGPHAAAYDELYEHWREL